MKNTISEVQKEQADLLFTTRYASECQSISRFMVWLMFGQWVMGMAFAIFIAPYTWIGERYETNIHVWAAVLMGGALSGTTIFWLKTRPDSAFTRHLMAATQMLWSALLIHLSGGRIETHFHVFASLAILSLYRDWKILITATIIVAVDHAVRGVFYPLSAFGVVNETPFRWIEHAAWVIFEVAFLVPGCMRLKSEIYELCLRQTWIEEAKRNVDLKVDLRTQALVTANDKLAKATREAETLALVARFTDNAVTITDADAKIEWVNEGFTRITGYTLEEVRGKRSGDFRPGKGSDQAQGDQMRAAVESKKGFDAEVVSYHKSGEAYWLATEVRPIRNQTGQVTRFIAIESDISERKKMETSLAAAEQKLRSLINNIPGVIYRVDVTNDPTPLFVTDSIEELTGHATADFVENRVVALEDFIHPGDRQATRKVIERALLDTEPYEVEYRVVDKHGNTKTVCERGQHSVSENGDIILDGMIFDVSERVDAEKRTSKLQRELVDASRQAGMAEVATGVLHNVGNILNSVNISAGVIQKRFSRSAISNLAKLSDLVSEHEATFADFIRDDNRGQKIPNYILKVTDALRSERDEIGLEFSDLVKNVDHIKEIVNAQQSMAKSSGLMQELNPRELIRDVRAANKGSLANHQITYVEEIEPDLPDFVSDKHKIMQVLINLVKNAKDALVENQTVSPEICFRVATVAGEIVFQVVDNGVGIEPEKIDRLFQHGYTTKKTGHGFGLHSSANAATELGGSLAATSDGPGTGATFELRLPFERATVRTEDMSCN